MPNVSHCLVTKFDVSRKGWRLALWRRSHARLFVAREIFLLKKIVSAFNLMLLEQLHKFMHVLDNIRCISFSFSCVCWWSTLRDDIMLLVKSDLGNFIYWLPKVISVLLFIQVIKQRLECQRDIVSFLIWGIKFLFFILILDSFISNLPHYPSEFHQFFVVSAKLLELLNSYMAWAICVQYLKYALYLILVKN